MGWESKPSHPKYHIFMPPLAEWVLADSWFSVMLQQFLLYEFPLHQFPLYQFPLLQHFPLHQIPFLMFWADNFLLYHFLSFIVTSDSFTSVSVIPISFFGYIRFRCNNFRFIVISVSVKSVSIISESVISISFFCYIRFRYISFLEKCYITFRYIKFRYINFPIPICQKRMYLLYPWCQSHIQTLYH